jgi:HPt (histidine-containing phosphotransfer) domain-containing protein
MDYSAHQLLDIPRATEVIGDEEILFDMLGKFMDMNKDALNSLKEGVEKSDYQIIRNEAHTLKGSSSYIGATKISMIAKHMQDSCDQKSYKEAIDDYPIFIYEIVNTKREIRVVLAHRKQEDADKEDEADYDIPVAKDYVWALKSPKPPNKEYPSEINLQQTHDSSKKPDLDKPKGDSPKKEEKPKAKKSVCKCIVF